MRLDALGLLLSGLAGHPPRESLVSDIPARDGKIFLQCKVFLQVKDMHELNTSEQSYGPKVRTVFQ